MDTVFADRCPKCGEIVEYTAEASVLECWACHHTFRVAEFVSQRLRVEQALADGEKAKREAAASNAAKAELQERLNGTLHVLDAIQSSQESGKAALDSVLETLKEDRQTYQAMTGLLHAIRADQGKEQDALTRLMCAVMQGQNGTEAKLSEVRRLAERILAAQTDGLLAEKKMQRDIQAELKQLKMDEGVRAKLLKDFMAWSRTMQEGDVKRLQALQDSSGELIKGQREIAAQMKHIDDTMKAGFSKLDKQRLEKLTELYHQATGFQAAREFDKAAEKYLALLAEGGNEAKDAEVYWRLLLCHYGVEYQEENGKLIPIILRPDLTDPSLVTARKDLFMHIKTEEQSRYYSGLLEKIDFYLQRYREVKQDPNWQFDVFISVKQKFNGRSTMDHWAGLRLYKHLKFEDEKLAAMNLKVFNSETTKPPDGEPYEPYIIAALMSAKVMIVVGSTPEFMSSQWVKNEWSRFQYLKRCDEKLTGHSDRKLLCYLIGGMAPNKIPIELDPNVQAIVEGPDSGARLYDVMQRAFPNRVVSVDGPDPYRNMKVEELLERGYVELGDGSFDKASPYFDRVLRKEPKNSDANMGMLLVDLKLRHWTELTKQDVYFRSNKYCRRILDYGDDTIKKVINDALDVISKRILDRKTTELKGYLHAVSVLFEQEKWLDAKKLLDSITPDYKEYAEIYLYKLLAEYELPSEKALCTFIGAFEEHELWEKVCKYATEEQKKKYQGYVDQARLVRGIKPAEELVKSEVKVPDGKIASYKGILIWLVLAVCTAVVVFSPDVVSSACRFWLMQRPLWMWAVIVCVGLILIATPLGWLKKTIGNVRARRRARFSVKVYPNNEVICRWRNDLNMNYAISVDQNWVCEAKKDRAAFSFPADNQKHRIALSCVDPDLVKTNKQACAKCEGNIFIKKGKRKWSLSAVNNAYTALLTIVCSLALAAFAAVMLVMVDSFIELDARGGTADGRNHFTRLQWTEIRNLEIPSLVGTDSSIQYVIRRNKQSSDTWETLMVTNSNYFYDIPINTSGTYTYEVEAAYLKGPDAEPVVIGSERAEVHIPATDSDAITIVSEPSKRFLSTVSADVVAVSETMEHPLIGLRLFGKTMQERMPSPYAPVPMTDAGDTGSIVVHTRGKNLIDSAVWEDTEYEGVTTTRNADGSITVKGANMASYVVNHPVTASLILQPGTYSLSGGSTEDNCYLVMAYEQENGMTSFQVSPATFVIEEENTPALIYLQVAVGTSVDVTIYPQLECGDAITDYEPYQDGGTANVLTPNGLPGIPVTSGGNYTDENGQQWICDEIDLVRGIYVKNVHSVAIDDTYQWAIANCIDGVNILYCDGLLLPKTGQDAGFCSHFQYGFHSAYSGLDGYIGIQNERVANQYVRIWVATTMSRDEFMAYVANQYAMGTPLTICYPTVKEERALEDGEGGDFRSMTSQARNTTICNDAGAGMTVRYLTDLADQAEEANEDEVESATSVPNDVEYAVTE